MTYIPTGVDLFRGGTKAAPATAQADRPCEAWPTMVQRDQRTGTSKTISGCAAWSAGYTYDSAANIWRRRPASSGRATDVREGESLRSPCLSRFRGNTERYDWCVKLLEEGKSWQEAVCTPVGGAKGLAEKLRLKQCIRTSKDKLGTGRESTGEGVVREHRFQVLLAECAAAGVPKAFLEQCVAARQQGYSIEEAAGAALQQASVAAKKRRTLLIAGAGALALGLVLYKKGRK